MSNVSLHEILQRRTLPAKPLQIAILRQIAGQLDEAHQRRLIHGNLNPQNILVSEAETDREVSVFVKGFGGKFDMDPRAMSAPPPVEAYYLSPEQVLGIDPGPQSDEFSFAAIAYELLSGSRPFTAAKLSGLIFAICSDSAKPVDELNGSLSAGVSSVVNRSLSKDPQARYSTCGEFAAALENELVLCSGWTQSETVTEPLPVAAASISQPAAEPEPIPVTVPSPSFAAAPFEAPRFQNPEFTPRARSTEEPPVTSERTEWIPRPEPRPFVPAAEPLNGRTRTAYDLPSGQRRNRYGDADESPETSSPVKKIALAGLILFALAAALFFFNGSPRSDLPTQVLDTKNAPVTPPPAKDESASAQTQSPAAAASPAAAPTASQQTAAPPPDARKAPQAEPAPQPQSAASQASRGAAQPLPTPPGRTTTQITPVAHQPTGPGLVDVELLSDPPGASIIIDNNPALACKAPCNISLSDGRHTLSASMAGFTLAQRIFNVPETSSVFVTMPRLTGALVVTSTPTAATILIDGKDFGLTPATLHLPPGQHRITLMNGSQRHDEEVTVVADGIQATGYTFAR